MLESSPFALFCGVLPRSVSGISLAGSERHIVEAAIWPDGRRKSDLRSGAGKYEKHATLYQSLPETSASLVDVVEQLLRIEQKQDQMKVSTGQQDRALKRSGWMASMLEGRQVDVNSRI